MTVVVAIDGAPIYDGSFLSGMDVCVPVMPAWLRVLSMDVLGTGVWQALTRS